MGYGVMGWMGRYGRVIKNGECLRLAPVISEMQEIMVSPSLCNTIRVVADLDQIHLIYDTSPHHWQERVYPSYINPAILQISSSSNQMILKKPPISSHSKDVSAYSVHFLYAILNVKQGESTLQTPYPPLDPAQ
jgi:hypothetical protein